MRGLLYISIHTGGAEVYKLILCHKKINAIKSKLHGNLNFDSANTGDFKVPTYDEEDDFYKKEIEKMKTADVLNADAFAEFVDEMIELESFEKRKNNFLYGCHYVMKEHITKHFPEIVDLPGNTILNVNFTAYVSIINFNEAFIYLAFYKD